MHDHEAFAAGSLPTQAKAMPSGASLQPSVRAAHAVARSVRQNGFFYHAPGALPKMIAPTRMLRPENRLENHTSPTTSTSDIHYGGAFGLQALMNTQNGFGTFGHVPTDSQTGGLIAPAFDDADDWDDNTIVEIPYGPRPDATFLTGGGLADERDRAINRRSFRIRPADDHGRRTAASMLIDKMYSRRGYETGFLQADSHPNRITLVASDDDNDTLGTLSLGLDSSAGLLVDEMYCDEVDALRAQGRSVCELTKLAVDQAQGSKRVLASLFHIAYIYGRILNQVTDVFIEVNPRHAPFYRRMLGFRQCGEIRTCPRVNAPAVLLRLELDHVDAQIQALGGQAEVGSAERSLYPYFFSKREEAGIARRLRTLG